MSAYPIDDLILVIGAMKAGTSSLHAYLDRHPEISMSRTKELEFFVEERNFRRGLAWYQRQLSSGPGLKGESSPSYTKCTLFKGVPERIRGFVARPRLVYVVRDPVKRVVAHWVHNYADGREARPLSVMLEDLEDNHYLDASRYGMQLERYLEHFAEHEIRVVSLERLQREPQAIMREVFEFVGVDPAFEDESFGEVFHASSEKKTLSPLGRRIRQLPGGRAFRKYLGWIFEEPFGRPALGPSDESCLIEALSPDVEKLRSLTGQRFPEWCL